MRSKVLQRILDRATKDQIIFVGLYGDIVVRVNQLLKEKNLTQKALAEGMGKKPSEISKWLNGEHNFTLRSLAKLEAELGEPIITVPKRKAFAQASQKTLQLKAPASHLPKETTFTSGKFQKEDTETQVA